MRRLGIVAIGLALVVGVCTMVLTACTSGKVAEKTVVVTPTVAPAPTPEPKRTITLADAPSYLNVSDILPGFKRLDPNQEGMGKEAAAQWFGEDADNFSDFQLYLSDQPFQYVFMTMGVFPGSVQLAAWKASVRDEKTFSEQFLQSLTQTFTASAGLEATPQTSVTWKDVAVGESARLGEVSLVYQGGQLRVDVLMMFQENTVVLIYDMWYPAEPRTVDMLTVARAVSSNIANR